MTTADAKHATLVCHHCPAELRYIEIIFQVNSMRDHLIDIKEMNVLGSPLEIVNELATAITLLQYECILQEFTELFNHIDIRVVGNPARQLPQLSLLADQVLADLLKTRANALELKEVEVALVVFEEGDLLLEFVELLHHTRHLPDYVLLLLLTILDVPERLLVEVVLQEQLLNLLELVLQVVKLLVIVFLDGGDFFADAAQLADLVLHLLLEEAHLVLEVLHAQLLQHHHVVVAVLPQQTLEADGAQVALAEGLNLLCWVNFTHTLLELTYLIVTHCIFGYLSHLVAQMYRWLSLFNVIQIIYYYIIN